MKYCIHYCNNFRYNDIIDEVIYEYKNNIVDIIQQNDWKEEQRLIINLHSNTLIKEDVLPILKMCKKIHNNCAILLKNNNDNMEALSKELQKNHIDYFYNKYASTKEEVYGLIKMGVSDVYVTEEAGFSLKNIGLYCKFKGVKVRVIPNLAQYTIGYAEYIPDEYKFFIRPEDTKFYEPYVDVFELINNVAVLSVIYEIYRDQTWPGNLNEVINGINIKISNQIPETFGSMRVNCNHKCMTGNCNLCTKMLNLANTIANSSFTVIKNDENKEWKYETDTYKKALQFAERTTTKNNS